MIDKVDETGNLPLAFDEKDKLYRAVQPTVVQCSPVKKTKTIEVEDDEEKKVTRKLMFVCFESWC